MENYSTKHISKMLGVSEKKIRDLIKQLTVTVPKNASGHFLFNNEHIEALKELLYYTNNVTEQQVAVAIEKEDTSTTVIKQEVDEQHPSFKLQLKELQMELIRQKEEMKYLQYEISTKANEVVSLQLLEHRREIEDLHSEIRFLKSIIHEIQIEEPSTIEIVENKATHFLSKKKKGLLSLFSS